MSMAAVVSLLSRWVRSVHLTNRFFDCADKNQNTGSLGTRRVVPEISTVALCPQRVKWGRVTKPLRRMSLGLCTSLQLTTMWRSINPCWQYYRFMHPLSPAVSQLVTTRWTQIVLLLSLLPSTVVGIKAMSRSLSPSTSRVWIKAMSRSLSPTTSGVWIKAMSRSLSPSTSCVWIKASFIAKLLYLTCGCN